MLPPTMEKISFRGAPEEIGQQAFSGNTKIKTFTLPDSIKYIEPYAFENCIALESINFPASLRVVARDAFSSCNNLKEIIIPDSLTSTSLGLTNDCFGGCSSLPLATQARLKQLGYTGSF